MTRMQVLRGAKAMVAGSIRRMGFEISPKSTAPTVDVALGRMAGRVDVRTVIDVGASDGRWTLAAMRHFPRARLLVVEAYNFDCADLADPKRSPGNEFLWPMALFFVPGARPEFASNDHEQGGDR
jgi:hypothetical protein